MNETKSLTGRSANERILSSATELFAQSGYKGVSTREISIAAQVNEVTIFRHFPRKHDLYLAVIEAGLQRVRLRGDLLTKIAEARDGRTALTRTFELIARTLTQDPEILRLLHFSALEMGDDFDPLVRKHLGELVEVIARYLDPWVTKGELRCTNTKTLIFTLSAIVMSNSVHRVFSSQGQTIESMFETYVDFCTS